MILIDEETAILDCEGLTCDAMSDTDVNKTDKFDKFKECVSDCVAVITILADEDDDNDSIKDEDDLIKFVDLVECDSDLCGTIILDDSDCNPNELDVVKVLKFNELEPSDLDDDFTIIELIDLEPTSFDDKSALLDSDVKMEPDDFTKELIELDDFVTMEMFDTEMTDLNDDGEPPVFETFGLGEIFVTMEMFDIEMSNLGDDVELPVFETIGLKDVSDNCMGNEDEGAYGINDVELAALDSDAKMEPDDLKEKCIELNDFVTMEMFDIEMTDLGDDVELPVFEAIGLKNVSDNCMGNEDEGRYGINGVEAPALDSDAKIEPDDCNEKYIDFELFVTIAMYDIEMTDLGDADELPVFEKIGLEDVSDNCMGNEDERVYGINGVEEAALDFDVKIKPDDFNEKCIEFNDFVAMEMFDIEITDLGDNKELPVFEII